MSLDLLQRVFQALPTGNPILHCWGARAELLQRTSCGPCRLEFLTLLLLV
jgi:hypothetical protein